MGRMKKTKDSLVFKGGKIPIEGEDREVSEIGLSGYPLDSSIHNI